MQPEEDDYHHKILHPAIIESDHDIDDSDEGPLDFLHSIKILPTPTPVPSPVVSVHTVHVAPKPVIVHHTALNPDSFIINPTHDDFAKLFKFIQQDSPKIVSHKNCPLCNKRRRRKKKLGLSFLFKKRGINVNKKMRFRRGPKTVKLDKNTKIPIFSNRLPILDLSDVQPRRRHKTKKKIVRRRKRFHRIRVGNTSSNYEPTLGDEFKKLSALLDQKETPTSKTNKKKISVNHTLHKETPTHHHFTVVNAK